MVNRIYPPELQLNKANNSDTEAPFLDLHLSISNGGTSVVVAKGYLFLLSVFILWFSYYVSDIFCKF